MEISQRFGSAGNASPRLQSPVKFGNIATQSMPELGIIPKVALPIMIGSIVYLIHRQSSKMSAALGETLKLVKEGQELAARGKTKQLIWNGVNSGGLLAALGTSAYHIFKFMKLEPRVDTLEDNVGKLNAFAIDTIPKVKEATKYTQPIKLLQQYLGSKKDDGSTKNWTYDGVHELGWAMHHAGLIDKPN